MRKVIELIKYILTKRKKFIKTLLNQIVFGIGFYITSLLLYVLVVWRMNDQISKELLLAMVLFNLVVIPVFYFKSGYRYIVNSLFNDLVEENRDVLHNNVDKVVEGVEKKKEELKGGDLWLKLFNWLNVLPGSIRFFIEKLLEKIPYYNVMKIALSDEYQLVEKQSLAKKSLDDYLAELFSTRKSRNWMIILSLGNVIALIAYHWL